MLGAVKYFNLKSSPNED